jgi:Fic family protein
MAFLLAPLPVNKADFSESAELLRIVAKAHRFLGELKGAVSAMPNASLLIDTLALQEAQRSSEIENIITTTDDLYQSDPLTESYLDASAKEVHRYAQGLTKGFERLRERGVLRLQDILDVQGSLVDHHAGLRKLPGTILRNQSTGATVYEPPQDPRVIEELMSNFLEQFHLDSPPHDMLIQMAILHFQFESIHPFYDGNGRTGRILNTLYLVLHGLLDVPVLYLSRYIVRTKDEYYQRLQDVRERQAWSEWVMYLVKGVEETAKDTLERVRSIRTLIDETRHLISTEQPSIYSQELVNNIFRHPYTKREYVQRELGVSRPTATKYLNHLVDLNILEVRKRGQSNYYINRALVDVLIAD